MDNNRKTAMEILTEVETRKAYSNIALNSFIAKNKPDAQGMVREIVYGVLKNKLYIDYILSQFVSTPLSKLKANTLSILRMGIYQMTFMHSVPEYAAVNESVKLAKKFAAGQSGFINGVLRAYARKKTTIELPKKEEDLALYLSVKYSYVPWIVRLWLENFEADFVEDLLRFGNETPKLSIRVNGLKENRDNLIEKLTLEGFEAEKGLLAEEAIHIKGSDLLRSPLFANGEFSVQDESSMLAVSILDPKPGDLVLDVCAAPGGKTLFIAEKMKNQGKVIAWDLYDHKLDLLNKAALRNGITIIETKSWDSTVVDPLYLNQADRVLVDAPCSGLGVIRKKPEIKYGKDSGIIEALSLIQLKILSTASGYVKPGGVLLYSTCTISALENEQIILSFLDENKAFEMVYQKQLFPNVEHTDGFFISKLLKKNDK